jgi:hypothetical protein
MALWSGRSLPSAASDLYDERCVYVLCRTEKRQPVFTGQSCSLRRRAIAYMHSDWLRNENEAFGLVSIMPAREFRLLEPVSALVEPSEPLPPAPFWELVTSARRYGAGLMSGGLRALLVREGAEVAAGFAKRWEDLTTSLYSWSAWDVAYVMQGGCSDDSFEYFRSWMITLGRQAVEEFIEDPLAWALRRPPAMTMGEGQDDGERMSYAPFEAYEQVTGERLVRRWPSRGAIPAGEKTPENEIDARCAELVAYRRPERDADERQSPGNSD